MKSFQKNRGLNNILQSKPALVLFGLLIIFFAWNMLGFLSRMNTTRENRILAENKVSELNKQKEKLTHDIAKLNTENGVEETIREKFGLAKDGEEMIVVVDQKLPLQADNSSFSGGFFSFFKNWFK